MRGEYLGFDQELCDSRELPPHARRIPNPLRLQIMHGGTTSACAENTQALANHLRKMGNYLRMRGEYVVDAGFKRRACGTTSACAENTRRG